MASVGFDGVSIGYDDVGPATGGVGGTGAGDVVVLVHGHPFDRSMWAPQLAHLPGTGWRAVAADLRGYGESTVVPGAVTLDVFAGDIARLLDHLGVGAVVLAGLSMGGQIVMELLRLFPERVRGIVLADTSPVAETADGRRSRNAVADRLLAEGMTGYAEELLPMMLAPGTIRDRRDVADHVSRMMSRTSPVGAAAALRGRAERPDYRSTLRRTTVPARVVVGTDDAYTSVEDARDTAALLPTGRLAVVHGAGHMPNLERPDEFNALLDELLDVVRKEPHRA